jgi:hypothetical protein
MGPTTLNSASFDERSKTNAEQEARRAARQPERRDAWPPQQTAAGGSPAGFASSRVQEPRVDDENAEDQLRGDLRRNACAREGIQSMNDETDPYDLRLEVNGRSPSTIREASWADLETLGEQLGIQCAQRIFPDAREELSREIFATEDASLKFLELENRVR